MTGWMKVVGCGVVLAGVSLGWGHEIVFDVGHTAGGRLKAGYDFAEPVVEPVSVFPGIGGFADSEPAFHSLLADEVGEDLYVLPAGGDYRWVLVAKDAGVQVLNDTGSGFMGVGDSFYIGVAPFDTHPLWDLVAGAQVGVTYSVTLKLVDLSGGYGESEPFTVGFAAVPEPGVMMGVAGVAILGRRRRG